MSDAPNVPRDDRREFIQMADLSISECCHGRMQHGILPSDPASIQFTSGTTGPSKGVLMPNGSFHFNAKEIIAVHGITEEDSFLCPFPLFHGSGRQSAVYPMLVAGGKCVLYPKFSGTRFLDRARQSHLDGVMLPKADSAEQVRELDLLLTYYEGRAGMPKGTVSILILPETAKGMHDARQMAAASPRVKGITGAVLGTGAAGDFATALGIWPSATGEEQNYIVSKLSLDSRAAGALYPIAVVNGVQIDDLATVKQLALRAKVSGYTGVLVIHPTHLAVVHEVFTPTDEEVRYYQAILDALKETDQKGNGAVRFGGEMIDYAMIARANQFLRDAERLKRS